MPTFSDVDVTVTASIDFEVFCGTCGAGLCNQSDTRSSRNRNYPQVTVDVCQKCIDEACDIVRDEMQKTIDELKDEIYALQLKNAA